MAPKQILDRNAWQWAEQTDPSKITLKNILTAYRMTLPTCPVTQGSCRKNCVGNPKCYCGLGEKAWMDKNLDEELKDALNESSKGGKRIPGSFIGLKNLGATCYANTFLQVWFHNPEFRKGILDCGAYEHSQSSCDNAAIVQDSSSLNATNVVKHLQLLFALLSFSDRQFIDPSSFIECLNLDTTLQQDAQEFSKLFISLLEDQLPTKSCYQGVNLIQYQFVGHYEYVTRCSGCEQQSRSGSKFYEIDLNIKGHTNLAECLQEFLQEEKLDGENQYYCQFCLKKQNAVRRIHLIDLPPTLNFQLLRFVFDRHTQNKKKLLSYLQFPEVLNMNEYMDSSDKQRNDLIYDLVSVLIHRGPGAHSGHYVAVIKDCDSNATYQFNDEEVEKLADSRFRLDKEEDADGSKLSQKKPRPLKGYLCSRNAYMLVYRQRNMGRDCSPELTLESISPQLQFLVQMDNQKHEESLRDHLETRKFYISKEREKQELVKHFYDLLQREQDTERDDMYEWISSSWIKNWLAADSMGIVLPIDNVSLRCPHEKMHPENVDKAKLVPIAAADLIFEKFGGCLRLRCSSSMCHRCVEEKCRFIHSRVMISEDSKTITQLLKSTDLLLDCGTSYWVGKNSLKKWRGMAEEALHLTSVLPKENGEQENDDDDGSKNVNMETQLEENCASVPCNSNRDVNTEGSCDMVDDTSSLEMPQMPGAEEGGDCSEQDSWAFNEDLLCAAHGNLTPDPSVRRLVPQDTWFLLRKYFPKAPEFLSNSPVCLFCQTRDEKVRRNKEQDKAIAAEQRLLLTDLYLDKKRPSCWSADVAVLNVVSVRFLEEWRKFIRDPARNLPVLTTDNVSLLCHHSGFMYNVNISEQLSQKYVYIWPQEWEILTNYMKTDIEIMVTRILDESNAQQLVVYPDFCKECCRERQEFEYSSQFTYENESLYVRKVTDETMALFAQTLASSSVSSTFVTAVDAELNADELDDAEFINENGKRKQNVGPAEKSARLETSSSAPIRRSARKGRIHDEIKFEVSSNLTLKDLKLKLVKAFSVMKMDQHLYLDGIELCDELSTLGQLKVLPGSILYLQADEPSTDLAFMEVSPVNSVEEGFKGTGLVGR